MLLTFRHFVCTFVSLVLVFQVQSQQWQLDPENSPEITITGTSTLHDWKVTCADVQDVPKGLSFDLKDQNQIIEFGFKVPVDSMDGGRGSSMNTKIFDAFLSADNPFVEYHQNQPATITETADQGVFNITSTGKLSMAGTDKDITVQCTGTIESGALVIKGSLDLKMSEYGMVPPTAMFGQIKTNDDVVVSFEFRYLAE